MWSLYNMCSAYVDARADTPPDPAPQPEAPIEDQPPPSVNARTKLSTNFTLSEMVRSRTARAKGIDNTPTSQHVNNLRVLVSNVLQPLRNVKGAVTVTSGYRGPALNKAIGGARTSHHMRGMAADIVPTGTTTLKELGKWIQDHCKYTQLIYEFGEWLHVSYDPDDLRQQTLEAYHVVKRDKHGNPRIGRDGQPLRATRYRTYRFD